MTVFGHVEFQRESLFFGGRRVLFVERRDVGTKTVSFAPRRAITASSAKSSASRKNARGMPALTPARTPSISAPFAALQSRVCDIKQLLVYATKYRFPPTRNCSKAENSELGCAGQPTYCVVKSKDEATSSREPQLNSRNTCKTLAPILQNKPAQIGILCQIPDVLAHIGGVDLQRFARAVGRGE